MEVKKWKSLTANRIVRIKKLQNQNYEMRNSNYKNRKSRDSKIEIRNERFEFSNKDYQVGRIGIENVDLLFKYLETE